MKKNFFSRVWVLSLVLATQIPWASASEKPYASEINLVRRQRRAIVQTAAPIYLAEQQLTANFGVVDRVLKDLDLQSQKVFSPFEKSISLTEISSLLVRVEDFQYSLEKAKAELRNTLPALHQAGVSLARARQMGAAFPSLDTDSLSPAGWMRFEAALSTRLDEWSQAVQSRRQQIMRLRDLRIDEAVAKESQATEARIRRVEEEVRFSKRLGEWKGIFLLLDSAIGKALSEGDRERALEVFQGRRWLHSRLEMLPAILNQKASLTPRSARGWRILMEWSSAREKEWQEGDLAPWLAASTVALKRRSFARLLDDTTIDEEGVPQVPADEPEDPKSGAGLEADRERVGEGFFNGLGLEFSRDSGARDQVIEKFEGVRGVDLNDPFVRLELGLPPRESLPSSKEVQGIALKEDGGPRVKDIAPIPTPEEVQHHLAEELRQETAVPSLENRIHRQGELVREGIGRDSNSRKEREGLLRLKQEVEATLLAKKWFDDEVAAGLSDLSGSLIARLKDLGRPLQAGLDASIELGPVTLSGADVAEGVVESLTPGYDIANLIVALSSGQTLTGEKVEGGAGWGILGAAAVLSVVEPFGSKAPALKSLEKALRHKHLSEEAARGLGKLIESGQERAIGPLLDLPGEVAEKLGKIMAGAKKVEVRTAAEKNADFMKKAADKKWSDALPPHHPDFPVIQVKGAPEGTRGFRAHSAKGEAGGEWFSLTDPRTVGKEKTRDDFGILDRFGNPLDTVTPIDLKDQDFLISIARPMQDPVTGEFRRGGGVQGYFEDGWKKVDESAWKKSEPWVE